MNTGWSPKPLRPEAENPLFEMYEAPVVVKGMTPMQRQRHEDGTPHTRTGPTALRPADPEITLRSDLVKGSLVAKFDERPKAIKQDPQDPISVVKSYLAKAAEVKPKEEDKVMAKSIASMNDAIQAVLRTTGVK